MRWWSAVGLVTLAGCEPGTVDLAVDLRTDFLPGIEFVAVRTELGGTGASTERAALGDRSFLTGARVAELNGLAPGTHFVRLTLVDGFGDPVAERPFLIEALSSRAVTVVVSRNCAGRTCPSGQTCFGGQCADERCLYDEPGCPRECAMASDCPVLAACAIARCEAGICLYRADDTACDAGTYCRPECGCIPLPPSPGDASAPDPLRFCGPCNEDCTRFANGTGACVEGACVLVACAPGFRDCDGDPSNGCEARPEWTAEGGGDHCGDDWAPEDGDVLGGAHRRVGRFFVREDVTVSVIPFDGAGGGELSVAAETIEVLGRIDATGRGAIGGDGGGGRGSGNPYCGGDGQRGNPGTGAFGGTPGVGGRGHGGNDQNDAGCRSANGRAGDPGGAGGYAAPGTNGDTSEDDDVWIGSGGGGGGGGGAGSRFGSNNNFPAGTGGGGGAGGRGGGSIRLEARGALRITGAIVARGTVDGGDGGVGRGPSGCDRYQNPGGGPGGRAGERGASAGGARRCIDLSSCGGGTANTCGGNGGAGGAGAGGGVLLRGREVVIAPGAIDLRGGRGADNGGSLKVRYACALDADGDALSVGRYDARATEPCRP
ncbi:MAG: hypothetical protein KF729_09405 [Sandaracinaceae bacterium]|nr:hypothetical protein [Sandaracinaceae bacterium]